MPTGKTERLWSLDALRGADMLFIMGFSGAVVALCQLLGFGSDCWLAKQMVHVAWHGFRQHDTIFPLFLFLAAASYSFAALAAFYWAIDVKGWRRWTFF